MAFLAEYDSEADPRSQVGIVIRWLRTDWRAMYGELRDTRPILPTAAFTLVTRATDVLDVLAQPGRYSVRANRRSMDPAVGPFMLARDETEINWQEKGLMQAILRWDDLPRVRALAASVSADAIAQSQAEWLDVVPAIARRVPLRIAQKIFGFDAPDEAMLKWSFATQHGMFRNLPFSETVLADCVTAGQAMQSWLTPFLASKRSEPTSAESDSVSRLLELGRNPAVALSEDRILSNACGLLVGAIETTSQAIVQALDRLLAHPDWMKSALVADAAGDTAGFDAHVFEALRFNPITTIQFRIAEADVMLAEGTPYETPVPAGSLLAVATGSAMFDEALMPDPETFDASRPSQAYLHFGMGHHECLGRHVGQAAIPEAVRQILRLPGLRRTTGAAGNIDFANGPFPEHLVLAWDTPQSRLVVDHSAELGDGLEVVR